MASPIIPRARILAEFDPVNSERSVIGEAMAGHLPEEGAA